ncbi:MAG: hypothetical protein GOVbin2066_28 [Prokaryotic dsDNA virus sp.]|nr:MAG: hypothetical protein GOVbin2066_28 [Prokaryotic dsDNA virus sp.]|tara:strand:- start:13867 stop:14013 length:147 start_codon:yes stop_codon:yes gene_type:complete
MKHILICKQCGDVVMNDSHFDECSDDCILYETKDESFAGEAIVEYMRM